MKGLGSSSLFFACIVQFVKSHNSWSTLDCLPQQQRWVKLWGAARQAQAEKGSEFEGIFYQTNLKIILKLINLLFF